MRAPAPPSVRIELEAVPPPEGQPATLALSKTFAELVGDDLGREISPQFGQEARPVRLLQPGAALVGSARAPRANPTLSIDFGALEQRGRPAPPLLVARLRFESGRTQELRRELDLRPRWQTVELPLEAAEGEALELTLSLQLANDYVLVGIGTPRLSVPEIAPKTVLLVTSDTHRGDHVEGVPGAAVIDTPALRELASRGILFTDCWSTTNITIPSHVSIFTGLHPRDTGVNDNATILAADPDVLAERFRDAGWHTFSVTSLNLLSPTYSGLGQGFERTFNATTTRASAKTIDNALRMLDEAGARSVFAWVHVFDAHGPYEPHEPWSSRYYPGDPRSATIEPEPGLRVPPHLDGVRDAEYVRALYRGEIAHQDEQLARLFAHPRVRDGVVAFTGDHGEVLGSHGIWWAHKDVYPDTLHVPLALAWPGAPAGTVCATPVQNHDLGRTLLDLAGLAPVAFPGRNLAQLEQLEPGRPRFALSGARTAASITKDGWHLILQLETKDEPELRTHRERHQFELFDLRADPGARADLAAAEATRAKALRRELVEWLGGWKGERFAAFRRTDPEALANLAQLGYASNAPGDGAGAAPLVDPRCDCAWCARSR